MPAIPPIRRTPAEYVQLPGVHTTLTTPDDFGAGAARALSRAASQTADAVYTVQAARAREQAAKADAQQRRDTEAADSALTAYVSHADAALHGTIDPDGNPVPGLTSRQLADAKDAARDFHAQEKKWHEDPEGPYAKLTPAQQQIYLQASERYSRRFRSEAVNHELTETRAQRKLDVSAAAAANLSLAEKAYDADDETFTAYAGEYALRHGDATVHGQVALNPDGSRSFASPAAETLHKAAAAEALAQLRKSRAIHFADQATVAGLDPAGEAAAETLLARSLATRDTLPPKDYDDIVKATETARAHRKTLTRASRYDADAQTAAAEKADRENTDKTYQRFILDTVEGKGDPTAAVHALRAGVDTAYATRHIESVLAVAARLAESKDAQTKAQARQAADREKALDETANRYNVAILAAGANLTPDGSVVSLSPQERTAAATRLFTAGSITETQWRDAVKNAERDSDTRISQFSETALRDTLPKFADAFTRDPAGNFTLSDKRDNTGRPLHAPDTRTPYKDTYTETKAGKEIRRERAVLLSEAADALNIVKERMAVDPKMTPEAAHTWYKQLISGTLANADRLTIRQTLAEQQSLTASIRDNLTRRSLAQPKPQNPQP